MEKAPCWVVLLTAIGCASDSGASDPLVLPTDPLVIGDERDMLTFDEQLALGFRELGSGFEASGPGHHARFDGRWLYLDQRYPNGERCDQPLGIATAGIDVGDEPLDSTTLATMVTPRGELLIVRHGYAEKLVSNRTGVEQSWVFREQPATRGDIVVRVAVSGHELVGASPRGLAFGAPGALGSFYSHGVWIDAAGNQTDIAAQFEDGHIVLRVPAWVAATSSYPAILDPQIDLERSVDAPIPGSPTGANANSPAIAFSGAQYLAVWRDLRSDADGNLHATRLTATGSVSDPTSIVIAKAPGVQTNAVVAFVGSVYIVVWEDHKLPAGDPDLRAAQVTTGGVVLQLGAIAATAAAERRPRIAVRGSEALVVFESDDDVRGIRFAAGSFGAAFAIAGTPVAESEPDVAADPGGNYLVAFTSAGASRDLHGQLVSPAGALTGSAFVISDGAGDQEQAATTFSNGNFIAIWNNNSQGRRLYGTRVTPLGAILDTHLEGLLTVGGVLLVGAAPTQSVDPDIACSAVTCLVTWQDRRASTTLAHDVYAHLFDPDLSPIGADIAVSNLALDQRAPAVTLAGPNYFVIWQDLRDTSPEQIYGARVDATGTVLDPAGILVGRGYNRQIGPAVARSGTNHWLLAWSDSRTRGNNIMGVRVDNNGISAEPTPTTISNAPNQQDTPALAASGGQYLLAWTDQRNSTDMDIYGARVSEDGSVQDLTGFAIADATRDQSDASVAPDQSGGFLVVWQDRRSGPFDIYGAIVSSAGQLIAGDIAISTAAGDQLSPAVAFDAVAGVYVVVWQDPRAGGGARDIYATRVSKAGVVLDPGGVVVSDAAGAQLDPSIVFGTDRSLVVWEDRRTGIDVYGARLRVTGTGIVIDDPTGIAIATQTGKQQKPVAEYLSSSSQAFAVVWMDDRNNATNSTDIYGAVVFEVTGVAGSDFPIATSIDGERTPAISRGNVANGRVHALVTYQRNMPSFSQQRVVSRRLIFGDTFGTCSSDPCATSCSGGSTCEMDCGDANDCRTDCLAQSTCVTDCDTATVCRTDCLAGSTCNTDCRGVSDCRALCNSTGNPRTQCDINCADPTTGACNKIDCTGSAQCVLRCTPGAANCGFGNCPANQITNCGGGVFTCRRPCP